MHRSSYKIMKKMLSTYVFGQKTTSGSVLDFGSYNVNGSYRDLFNFSEWIYTGMDMKSGPNVDLVPRNLYKWEEIKSESFELVISGQAFEHCEYFWLVFEEFSRILKKVVFVSLLLHLLDTNIVFPLIVGDSTQTG